MDPSFWREVPFENICIVGVGLIGGSLGLALKEAYPSCRIIGVGRQEASLRKALERKVVDEVSLSLQDVVDRVDLVVLATPPSAVPSFLSLIGEKGREGLVVSDVVSIKRKIIEEAERVLPHHIVFIGGHPLAGSEKRGVEHAQGEIFRNALYILVPSRLSTEEGMEKMKKLIRDIGAIPYVLSASEHDHLLAYTSHFPHVVAFCLSLLLKRGEGKDGRVGRLLAGGFKSTTRIAKSPPDLWMEILWENRDNLLPLFQEWEELVGDFKKALQESPEMLLRLLTEAKEERERIDEVPLQESGTL